MFSSSARSMGKIKRKLIFFGAPGVGKGTFAGRVGPALRIPAISTGDIVRAEIKGGSDLGKKCQEYSDKGDLIPDELVDAMVEKRLAEPDAKRGFILDGYPRTVGQAKALDKYMEVDAVLNITLPTHVLMEKLLGRRSCEQCGRGFNVAAIHEGDLDMPPLLPKKGDCDQCDGEPNLLTRADDTEDIVRNRLEVYDRETSPVLDHYRGKGKTQDFAVKKGIQDVPRLFKDLGITVVEA